MNFKYKYLKYKKKYLELRNYAMRGGENIEKLKNILKNMIITKLNLYKFKYDEEDIDNEINLQYNKFRELNENYSENFDPQSRFRPEYVIFNFNEKVDYLFDKVIVKYEYNYIENLTGKNIENIKIGLDRLYTEEKKKLIIKDNYMTLFYILKMNDLSKSYKDILSLVIENVIDFIDSKIKLNLEKLNLSGGGFLKNIQEFYKDKKERKAKFKSLKEKIKNDTELNYGEKMKLQDIIKLGNLENLDVAYSKIKKKKEEEKIILAAESVKIKKFITYIENDDKLFENDDLKNNAIISLDDPDDLLRIYILSIYDVEDLGKILEKAKKKDNLKRYFVTEYRFMVEETIEKIKINYNYNKNNIIEDLLKFKDIDIEKYNLDILIFLHENYKEEIFLRIEDKSVLELLGMFLLKLKNTVSK